MWIDFIRVREATHKANQYGRRVHFALLFRKYFDVSGGSQGLSEEKSIPGMVKARVTTFIWSHATAGVSRFGPDHSH